MADKIYASQNRRGTPPMTIEHKRITLSCYLDDRRIGRQIDAYVCGGLALHESLSGGGRAISHVKDGVAIDHSIHQSMNYLRPILQELASLTDWDRSYHEVVNNLENNPDLGAKYKALRWELAPGQEPSVNGRHSSRR